MMRTLTVLLFIILVFRTFTSAHQGNQHLMGTVTAISSNSIAIRSANKEVKTTKVAVVSSTIFMKSSDHASLNDLKIGDRVVVEAKDNKDDKLEAVSVTFGKPASRANATDMHH